MPTTYLGRPVDLTPAHGEKFVAGVCESCGYVTALPGRHQRLAPCRGCGANVPMRAVVGQHSDSHNCDQACLFARGSTCVCACGGNNHQRGYLIAELVPDEIRERDTRAHRDRVAAAAERRAAAATEARTAVERTRSDWLEVDPTRAPLIAWLERTAEGIDPVGFGEFIHSLLDSYRNRGELTDGQESAVRRCVDREAARAAEPAIPAAPAPVGPNRLTGSILSVKATEGFRGGTAWKMTVRDDRGFRVYLTCPRSIIDAAMAEQAARSAGAGKWVGWADLLTGRRVTLSATLAPTEDDPTFAWASRPTGARLLDRAAEGASPT